MSPQDIDRWLEMWTEDLLDDTYPDEARSVKPDDEEEEDDRY